MGFLDKVKSLFAAGEGEEADALWIYVRCERCNEPIKTRIDLRHDLTPRYEAGGYFLRKTLMGSRRRCFQPIEVEMTFDSGRNLLTKEITGGQFITREEYEEEYEEDA